MKMPSIPQLQFRNFNLRRGHKKQVPAHEMFCQNKKPDSIPNHAALVLLASKARRINPLFPGPPYILVGRIHFPTLENDEHSFLLWCSRLLVCTILVFGFHKPSYRKPLKQQPCNVVLRWITPNFFPRNWKSGSASNNTKTTDLFKNHSTSNVVWYLEIL